ncbi:TPA: hypothetical protein ACGXMH_001319 [Bacillus mobilis]|uniref:hypothetical protein n=1 Tax=Bacillus mobilis TaxID=2026190 RepID=UPI0011A8ACCB|nr:hypothetical protein [Bacillus mobilis]MED4384979.1 hypothetical protein [Bacillus mobilis]HDX9638998.1 hypothetical protein [Bacillus mobilis]
MPKYSAKVVAGEFMKENTQFNAFVSNNTMNLNAYNPIYPSSTNIDAERWRQYINKVDLIDENRSKDTFKIAGRTILGSALLGTPGAIIGAASTKEDVICNILVTYKDGKRDLIECTEHIYKLLKQEQFKNALIKDNVELDDYNSNSTNDTSGPRYTPSEEVQQILANREQDKAENKILFSIFGVIFVFGIGLYLLLT